MENTVMRQNGRFMIPGVKSTFFIPSIFSRSVKMLTLNAEAIINQIINDYETKPAC